MKPTTVNLQLILSWHHHHLLQLHVCLVEDLDVSAQGLADPLGGVLVGARPPTHPGFFFLLRETKLFFLGLVLGLGLGLTHHWTPGPLTKLTVTSSAPAMSTLEPCLLCCCPIICFCAELRKQQQRTPPFFPRHACAVRPSCR